MQLARFLGLASIAALVVGFIGYALAGIPDGASSDVVSTAIEERGYALALAALMFVLAGVALALFLQHVAGGLGLPAWCKTIALLWGGTLVVAGMLLLSVGEMSGYQRNHDGARTVIQAVYLMVVSPLAAVFGGAFALAMSRSSLPALARRACLVLGVLALAGATLGIPGGIGMIGLAPVVLWWVGTAVYAAIRPFSRVPTTAAATPPHPL